MGILFCAVGLVAQAQQPPSFQAFGIGGQWLVSTGDIVTFDSTGMGTVNFRPSGSCPATATLVPSEYAFTFNYGGNCLNYYPSQMLVVDHNNAQGSLEPYQDYKPVSITMTRTGSQIIFEGQDTATQGRWTGNPAPIYYQGSLLWNGSYGAGGYIIPGEANTALNHTAFTLGQGFPYTWAGVTPDPRALQIPGAAVGGVASAFTNYFGQPLSFSLNIYDIIPHTVSFYLLDWDSSSRSETFTITDASTGQLYAQSTFSNFHNGLWIMWQLKGNLKITVTPNSGPGAAVSGIFVD
jgi:hypothetical protein